MKHILKLIGLFQDIIDNEKILIAQNDNIQLTLDKIVETLDTTQVVNNEFDITTQKEASLILNCSLPTLIKAIKDNTLKQDIHYKYNGKRKYFFCKNALANLKGTI